MAIMAEQLAGLISDALDDGKAQNTRVLDVRELTSVTDFMIIASGKTSRQVRALTQRVLQVGRDHGIKPIGTEGEKVWEWVLVDFGDVIVHAMQPQARNFYQLERLWDPREPQSEVV